MKRNFSKGGGMVESLISYRSKNNFSTVQDAWLFSLHQRHGTFINQRATLSLNGICESH